MKLPLLQTAATILLRRGMSKPATMAPAFAADIDGSRRSKRKQASDEPDASYIADGPSDDDPSHFKRKHAPAAAPIPAAPDHFGLVQAVQPRSITLEAWQIDARLWPGAAAAGWAITINKADDSKIYSAPDGCTFKARCLAVAHKVGPGQTPAAKPRVPRSATPPPCAAPCQPAAAPPPSSYGGSSRKQFSSPAHRPVTPRRPRSPAARGAHRPRGLGCHQTRFCTSSVSAAAAAAATAPPP
jgi:hypothetical protein